MGKVPGTDPSSSHLSLPYGSDPSRIFAMSWALCPLLSTFPSTVSIGTWLFQKPGQIPSSSPFTPFLLIIIFQLC